MLILGHRGAILDSGNFHQNSLRAFQEALQTAHGFETDACLDGDGEIFLIHEAKYVDSAKGVEYCLEEHLDDASIRLVAGRRLGQLTTPEARALRLKDGTPLVTMDAGLELTGRYPGKLIDIELKGDEVVEPVLSRVRENVADHKIKRGAVLLSSFNHPALKIVREEEPEIRVGAIFVGPDQASVPLFPWRPGSTGRYTALTVQELHAPLLKEVAPDYFIVPQEILTQETISLIAANYPSAQMMAWVFTEKNNFDIDDLLTRLDRLASTGKVAGMMVDNPRQFRAAYAKKCTL